MTLSSALLPDNEREKPRRYSREAWEAKKVIIRQFYVVEARPLRDVIRILDENLGFVVTESQLKKRLSTWGFDTKNVRSETMIELARTKAKRKRLENKESSFRVKKKPVDDRNTYRFLQRNDISEDKLLAMASPSPVPSPAYSVFTPQSISPPTPPDIGRGILRAAQEDQSPPRSNAQSDPLGYNLETKPPVTLLSPLMHEDLDAKLYALAGDGLQKVTLDDQQAIPRDDNDDVGRHMNDASSTTSWTFLLAKRRHTDPGKNRYISKGPRQMGMKKSSRSLYSWAACGFQTANPLLSLATRIAHAAAIFGASCARKPYIASAHSKTHDSSPKKERILRRGLLLGGLAVLPKS